MRKMKIKGMLWKPGVNGLGVGKLWVNRLLPFGGLFHQAAVAHDRHYDQKGDGALRKDADRLFLRGMLDVCTKGREAACAVLYYAAVRMFGWLFYRYDREGVV